MKTLCPSNKPAPAPLELWRRVAICALLLLSLGCLRPALADATVRTLGGGRLSPKGPDSGFTDGDLLQAAQFNTPFGCAVDAAGRVYVADRNNGALRRLDVTANRGRTLLQGLNQPVAVAVDRHSVVYVLTQGDGRIHKIDRGVVSLLSSRLFAPTALAYDGQDSLFVTQTDGSVVRVNVNDETVSPPLLRGLRQPGGIAVLDTGFLAISETGGHMIRIWDPRDGTLQRQIGTGLSGFADGPGPRALFNQPHHLARAPGGGLIVADRGNHRVRQIHPDAFVTTLYGVDPGTWEGPLCTTCAPMILPGWLDGSVEFAEAREPVGVAVSDDGKIYTTEVFYHLVREISGVTFTGSETGGGTNIVVLPPSCSPDRGYYPMGMPLTISNPNTSSFLPTGVYYTTDGSEPTTNSLQVTFQDGLGTLLWCEKDRDLSSLRLKAFLGNNASTVVSGRTVDAAEIGVPQDTMAGLGSTAILPVVINLRTNEQLKSLQFRVEVTPESDGIPMIPETFEPLSISTNNLIAVVTSEQANGVSEFRAAKYEIDRTRGAAITFIGTNANLSVKNFAVVAMLAIPIPPTAPVGSRYLVEVLNASGTADAAQARVPLASMPPRFITVSRTGYLVGDSSPATWFNAIASGPGAAFTGFGDGLLDNSDVNNVFAAALGNQVPYANTDLFDSMDAFPEDTVGSAGGDGLIRFLDWQVILLRSLGLDLARWERTWSEGGLRTTGGTGQSLASLPGQLLASPAPGAVWSRQARLTGQEMENALPGTTLDLPVYLHVSAGCQLAGLAFRATVLPEGTAPALDRPVRFVPSPNLPAPAQSLAPAIDTVLCGWPLVPSSSFDPPLRGVNLLGHVRVTVPATARREHVYTLRFSNADGSPDLQTQYEFETTPASLWVLSSALRPADPSSDEWKTRFFGSVTSDAARPEADPDHDGVPNSAEYISGTDPTDGRSYLHLRAAPLHKAGTGVVLRWLSAPGKTYRIEAAPSLSSGDWTVVASNLPGDGQLQEWVQTNLATQTRFYRIRLQP